MPGKLRMKEKGGGKAVQAGPNKETIDSILGSSKDWGNSIKKQMDSCFGTGIPCGTLAVMGGAVLILILIMKFL